MHNDPIVEEVRKIRDAHAAKFNYDLDAIFQDLKAKEQASGRQFVRYPPRPTKTPQKRATAQNS
jgi:hypothetical protein